MFKIIKLCGWRDLNSHEDFHQILSLARLPITPHPLLLDIQKHYKCKDQIAK